MTKIKTILMAAFLATFAAGAVTGLLVAHLSQRPHVPSWLGAELDLTSQQREQIRNIWSAVMSATARQRGEQRDALRLERDQKIKALLTAEQQASYEAILTEFSRKEAEMSEQRKQAFEEAVNRTKEILTPEQAAKYDELMKKQRERGFGPPHGGRRGPPPDGPPSPPPDNPHPPHGGGDIPIVR
ncbi:MAG TPA: hypothetical protein VNA25_01060 [Phycisphaerae bacterium]|nr:hypothetical protein [Phycisphaerae bacterium]